MSWPPQVEQVEVVSAQPYEHWRSEGVWMAVAGRTVRSVAVEEIFGLRGSDIGRYLNAFADDPLGALVRLSPMQHELTPLLGVAWQHGIEAGRQSTVHWAEESIFRTVRYGQSVSDLTWRDVHKLGVDPYLLRVVPSALSVFDQLTGDEQDLIERALAAVLGIE
jgi:hypothetical protein